jgi:hypothetical protein
MRWMRLIARIEEMRYVYTILEYKPQRKRSLGRPKHRWGTIYIIMDLKETKLESAGWIQLSQNGGKWWALAVMTS